MAASAGGAERKSNYITREGMQRLHDEYEHLWKVERPKVTEAVSVAAALGDRSENADYIYGKKRLREIDSRVRYLQRRIDQLQVVDSAPSNEEKVFFGAWVTLEDDEGAELRYRIVGPDESDATRGCISMDSPVGRALLGKQVDDEVQVVRPRGRARYTIAEIHYESSS
jgi:transcription elongation factor GreB